MNLITKWLSLSVFTLAVSFRAAIAADNVPAPATDLATQVQAIFKAKCTECHGPDVARPRGKFGYVLDLTRVAANPKLVQPGDPEKSLIYQFVRDEKMPTKKAAVPVLTAAEKDIVKQWIKAGASAPAAAKP